MTTAHTFPRSIIVGFAALAITFALTGTASAATSSIPDDVVVVSSTQLGSGTFTMTATNLGDAAVDLDLAAPGVVSDVTVDIGSFDGRWMIDDFGIGALATMTGLIAS